MLITLDSSGIIGSNFVYLCILTLSSHWYAKRWQGFTEHHFGRSSSFGENDHNSWTAWYTHGIFGSNFVYLCILTLSSHWNEKMWQGFTGHHFGLSRSFGENAHNSWTGWYIWFKFCILMYFNIVQPLVWKKVTRLHWASFWPVKLFWW